MSAKPFDECNLVRREFLRGTLLAAAAVAGVACHYAPAESASDSGSRPDRAVSHFMKSMNCSQAIFETYAPLYGLDAGTARKIGTPFAGGMGMGSECGAVTGALLVIGLKNGDSHKKTFAVVERLLAQFKARHGSTGCSQLLGVDMGSHAGIGKADKAGYFTTLCPHFVRTAAELLESTIVRA